MTAARRVWFLVPDGIDDATRPSGGNTYDIRVRDGLRALGWKVSQLDCHGAWPEPDLEALTRLGERLAGLPDGCLVLVDGLVGSAAAETLVGHAHRVRLVPLLHMPLDRGPEGQLLTAGVATVTTSHWSRRWVVDRYGLEQARVHAVPPGVDMADPVPLREDGTRLLCVGAVTHVKGHDDLLDALARLPDLDWQLAVMGSLHREPDFAQAVRAQARDHVAAGRVRFAGTATRTEVERAYADADVLVLASRAETYGMVVTEALAHALPVIGTSVGGVPEALGSTDDGSTPGLLVPPGDPDALARALGRWLEDPLLRRRLRRAALRRRLTLTGWSRTSALVAALLEELSGAPMPAGDHARLGAVRR